jgi:hypothetical protein
MESEQHLEDTGIGAGRLSGKGWMFGVHRLVDPGSGQWIVDSG